MNISHLTPGRLFELDGDLYLVENLHLHVVAQRIESAADLLDEVFEHGVAQPRHPVFMTLDGDFDDLVFSPERLKPLLKEEDLK